MEKKHRNCSFRKDLTGQTFGELKVVKYAGHSFWHCICSCGKETIVSTRNLTRNHTKSCGCLRFENAKKLAVDMTGFENEWLKVLKRDGSSNNGTAKWLCLCKQCGNTFTVVGSHIRNGQTKSCGCVKMGKRAINSELYRSYAEYEIAKILRENNVEFSREYTFPGLLGCGKRHIHFDFAIFHNGKLSHLIEYNGLQHYKNYSLYSKYFDNMVKNDAIKKEFCRKNNIELRIINYNDKITIENLI